MQATLEMMRQLSDAVAVVHGWRTCSAAASLTFTQALPIRRSLVVGL